MSLNDPSPDEPSGSRPAEIRLNIPRRYYLLPGAAILVGTTIGLFRGSRTASLRFLAENVHRAPTTVRGWYLYNKSKNYRVLMGGLKGAGADATKLALTAAGWVAIEEGCERLGAEDVSEVAAGVGTGLLFSAVYRLPLRGVQRTAILGVMIGTVLRGLRWGKERLREEAEVRARVAEVREGAEGADVEE